MASEQPNTSAISTPIKCLSFNCRGIPQGKKRSALLNIFSKGQYDFISLQETHIRDKKSINELKAQWRGPSHVSPGTGWGKGLITLFNPKYENNEVELVAHTDRVIISRLYLCSEIITIINVYAPCENVEKISFFNSLQPFIENLIGNGPSSHIILLGDLNVALNPIDVLS